MAPQHIDDLPRHEEPRQPMLGLIDDLPEERSRRARQLMMGGVWLAVVLVLFVVLVWVTAPTRQNSTVESDYAQNVGRPSY
jgi:flagellar biosynthesis/type III secretory pathway M-ring protein FliF/YscJ